MILDTSVILLQPVVEQMQCLLKCFFLGSWAFLCLWLNICSSQLSGDIKRRVRFNFGVFIFSSIWNVCLPSLICIGRHLRQTLLSVLITPLSHHHHQRCATFTQSDRESGVKDSWQLNFMPSPKLSLQLLSVLYLVNCLLLSSGYLLNSQLFDF